VFKSLLEEIVSQRAALAVRSLGVPKGAVEALAAT
jgi:hypothetical protein